MSQAFLYDLIVTQIQSTGFIYSAKRNTHIADRPMWGLLIKASGETIYTCQHRQYVCNQNYAILAPRSCTYEFDSVTAGEFVWLDFQALQSYDHLIQIPIKNCQALVAAVHRIDSLQMSKPPLYHMTCIAETYDILLGLLKSVTPKYVASVSQRKIQPAMDYLVQNYTSSLTNDQLAKQTEFSTSYFRKLFSDVYGISPLAYQRTLRINKAKEMLKSHTGSVSEIAAALGYSNIYDFSRVFKQETGISPSAYARNTQR